MKTDAIVAIQDMGAAGLTSSSIEMAGKGSVGLELDLDNVPQRETGMTAYEMMLSESQERMLMILARTARNRQGRYSRNGNSISPLSATLRTPVESSFASMVRSRRTFRWAL